MNEEVKILQTIPDGGPIFPGTEIGSILRLKPADFSGATYLWKQGNRILISFIAVTKEGQGTFSHLLNHLFDLGFTVCVPTPLGKMRVILKSKGFQETWEDDPDYGACEVWVKEPGGDGVSQSNE